VASRYSPVPRIPGQGDATVIASEMIIRAG
jgi:hypothetical protein